MMTAATHIYVFHPGSVFVSVHAPLGWDMVIVRGCMCPTVHYHSISELQSWTFQYCQLSVDNLYFILAFIQLCSQLVVNYLTEKFKLVGITIEASQKYFLEHHKVLFKHPCGYVAFISLMVHNVTRAVCKCQVQWEVAPSPHITDNPLCFVIS